MEEEEEKKKVFVDEVLKKWTWFILFRAWRKIESLEFLSASFFDNLVVDFGKSRERGE